MFNLKYVSVRIYFRSSRKKTVGKLIPVKIYTNKADNVIIF